MLIPEWRKAWKFLSVQVGAIAVLWAGLPADTQAAVLNFLKLDQQRLTGLIGLTMIVARLIAQPKVRN